MMGSGTLLSGTTMRISDEKGQGVRNRFVSSRVSARGLTLMRPSLVKRHTTLASGFFLFFRLTGPGAVDIWSRGLTSFPSAGADRTCLHHTHIEALSP